MSHPGHVALICVGAGALPFLAVDIDTGQPVLTWEQYAADSSLVIASYDDVAPGCSEPCEGDRWVLVWLPEDPTDAPTLPPAPPPETGTGCGRLFTFKRGR
jgi:hypothetical protein